jgi:DNA modification methylase
MVKQSEMGESREHPTQKPVELMSWCLQYAKGQVVMDAYMGSGTTGVAAVKAGHTFIGCEIEAEYFEVALRRIREAYQQPDLFHNPQGGNHETLADECKTTACA